MEDSPPASHSVPIPGKVVIRVAGNPAFSDPDELAQQETELPSFLYR